MYLRTLGTQETPVYLIDDECLSFSPVRGGGRDPVILISQPKSGTYLLARFLSHIGLIDTNVHADQWGLSDYRSKSIPEMRRDYLKFTVNVPIEVSAGLVAAGQFMVGHLAHCPEVLAATQHMRRLVLIRDARAALVSFMRFFLEPGRGAAKSKGWACEPEGPMRMAAFLDTLGRDLIPLTQRVIGWMYEPGTLTVRFEQIMGDWGPAAQRNALEEVVEHVGVTRPRDVVSLFHHEVVGQPTLTWSGARSELSRHWDHAVEARFSNLGGRDLQRALGYATEWQPVS